jgi:hypothetical protein
MPPSSILYLVLDRDGDPAGPRWVIVGTILDGDSRPAVLDDGGRPCDLAQAGEWTMRQAGPGADLLVPVDADVYLVDGDERYLQLRPCVLHCWFALSVQPRIRSCVPGAVDQLVSPDRWQASSFQAPRR